MFSFDLLREILGTIKKNKLRTALTGFSVAWGIFMLIVLVGAGNGLKNGMMYNFRNMATNRIMVWPGFSSMPYKGLQTNRRIEFQNTDYNRLRIENKNVEYASASISKNLQVSNNTEYGSYGIESVYPHHAKMEGIRMSTGDGRFVNDIDIVQRRKVIIISPRMKEVLFKSKDPLGSYVNVANIMFKVVGVYTDDDASNDAPAYIPFTTGQTIYNGGTGMNSLSFTINGIKNEEENEAYEMTFRENMGRRHRFDPADKRALPMWNTGTEFFMFGKIFSGIMVFIWIVGIGTLTAGIVGVSNIMLISVRERTREIGIRKAIGAPPGSIIRLVIVESIFLTVLFGYIGMVAGIGVTEIANSITEAMAAGAPAGRDNISIFRNPTVSLSLAVSATGLLVLAGVLAGYFPARKAVKITAIEAMRHE